jgi:phosphoglycolate phosphatase-like HAD superfamily hydrolase
MRPIIALDADGVLLDYHSAYQHAWGKAFGQIPALKDPKAYWPIDRWHVKKLTGDELSHFRIFFDENFWNSIPPIQGAIDACKRLYDGGYELVCVSAVESQFEAARSENLRSLGFPISRMLATSNDESENSPKAKTLHTIAPVAFVDDYLPYHRGINSKIHRALILREPNGSPNVGVELEIVDSQHANLAQFTDWWLSR